MAEQDIPKLYSSIGEVSRRLGVDAYVLRYWETEFRELAPRKNRRGTRQYRDQDIQVAERIKRLLYKERYTIEGARKRLREEHGKNVPAESNPEPDNALPQIQAEEIRRGLLEIKELLKG